MDVFDVTEKRGKGETSMNLMKMTEEDIRREVLLANARMKEEVMGNDPIAEDADFLDFLIESYDHKSDKGKTASGGD
jgi:hypothetical protein